VTDRDEDRLADLLLQWEEDEGISAQELCRDCPHLACELARRIEALKATAWLDKPVDLAQVQAEPHPPSKSDPRTLAGRYRLDDLIAEGGFAQVWKGFDLELQRVVAVKMPKPSRLGSVDAFIAEARKVARLKHPGIVPIFDTGGCAVQRGQQGGSCFLVSEHVEGGSLADLVAKGSLPSSVAARLVAEVAEALHYAHEQGFIHRDIKPGNILIDHHGRARITDFGIAVTTDEAGGPALGTLRYMSPEQVEGKPVDVRSDVFSVGMVLFELLTGRLPYSSADPITLRKEIIAGTGDLRFTGNADARLLRICNKAKQRNPGDRYSSAGEMAADLRRFLAGDSSGRWKLAGAVALVLILILIGVGLFVGLQNRGSPSTNPTNAEKPAIKKPASVDDALALGKKKFDRNYFEDAEKAYTEAIHLDPKSVEAYKRRGACKFNLGNFRESLPDFTKAIELDPNDAELCKVRALAYANLQEFTPAIADLEQALTLKPADAAPYDDLLARIYSNRAAEHARANRFAEAADDVTQAMKHDAKAAIFFHQRGSCYFNMKEYAKAEADWTVAIEREPTKAAHYLNRGHSRQAQGKDADARADFEKAKRLGSQ
jgi:tetratricopeptide (TPR) repeat protein/tRNA A-37 threonylcarbamoyl transferase component Bud32